MPLFLVLGSLAVAQPAAAAVKTPAGTDELNAIAKKVRAFVPRDQFDEPPPQSSMAGQTFSVVVEPRGSDSIPAACFGYPMWSYDAASRILYVSTGAHDFVLGPFYSKQGMLTKQIALYGPRQKVQYFASDCDRADLEPYTASNAYGADFRIEPTLQIITAIADALPGGLEWPTSFKIQTSGEQARALVSSLRVRFTGVLTDWKPGVSVACLNRSDGPIARSPYDRRYDICLFNGQIERIELLEVKTGKVLQTFFRPK